jgi:hypothetical protein
LTTSVSSSSQDGAQRFDVRAHDAGSTPGRPGDKEPAQPVANCREAREHRVQVGRFAPAELAHMPARRRPGALDRDDLLDLIQPAVPGGVPA